MNLRIFLKTHNIVGWAVTFITLNVLLVILNFILLHAYDCSVFLPQLNVENNLNVASKTFNNGNFFKSVGFSFKPTEQFPVLILAFNFSRDDGNYEMLRLSALKPFSSSWLKVKNGFVESKIDITDYDLDKPRDVEIIYENNTIKIKQDGILEISEPYKLLRTNIDMTFYPVALLSFLHTPMKTIKKLEIETIDQNGKIILSNYIKPIYFVLISILINFIFIALYLKMDQNISHFFLRRRSKKIYRIIYYGYPSWFLQLVFIGIPLIAIIATIHSQRLADWHDGFMDKDVFNAEKFIKNPTIYPGRDPQLIDLNPEVFKIYAFGGSTTLGGPYGRGKWDWPSQLGKLLNNNEKFNNRKFQVVNFSFAGKLIYENLPNGIDPFIIATKPRIMIFKSIINEFYCNHIGAMLANTLGFPLVTRDRNAIKNKAIYLGYINNAIDLCKKYNAIPVFIEAPLDTYFLKTNILLDWQIALKETTEKKNAIFVPLQKEFDLQEQRMIYHEYMHLSMVGYGLIAQRVYDKLLENKDLILNE
jgi:lysophospholipase L1-like esterase